MHLTQGSDQGLKYIKKNSAGNKADGRITLKWILSKQVVGMEGGQN